VPVYDTTRRPVERGIHVHARPTPESEKEIDFTYQAVRILRMGLPAEGIVVNQIDAIYYLNRNNLPAERYAARA
jgi:hypothetical protein